MRRPSLPIVGLVLVALLASACSTPVQRRDWSEFDGPGAEYFQREEIDVFDLADPIEPFNRGSWGFNHGLMVGVVQPLAWVYRLIIPGPVRRAVDRAATDANRWVHRQPNERRGNAWQARGHSSMRGR